jgi:hypothetical protein
VERAGDFIGLHEGDARQVHPLWLPASTKRATRLDWVRHFRATTTRDPSLVTLDAAFQITTTSMFQDDGFEGDQQQIRHGPGD